MTRGRLIALLLVLFLSSRHCLADTEARPPEKLPTISEKTSGMQKYPGYFPFYWDARIGKIWLEIDKLDTEFLYLDSLPAGVGSNDIGLDRGQLGDSRIVRFYRSGPRVILIESNYRFRASSTNPAEARAVRDSFAESALWGFEIAAEEGNRILLDASPFFLRDVRNVVGVLKETKQGDFKLEESRSLFYLPQTKNFPRNTEVEAMLTFTSTAPGQFVKDVAPTPENVTVREHHSFIQLPEPGYKPRALDARAGFFGIRYWDFAVPLEESIVRQFIARHRLNKKDPAAAVSEPINPIIYYVDSGTPEPMRSALLEGASWWNAAFEAAGFKNAFQVKLLPADADPMDIRYNVIQWVHRQTRGWSLGNVVIDPRTGEILKGRVTLGSQRVRQDYLIAEGLLAPYEEGKPASPEMREMALARLRQLSAHEVGHTLGLQHNFAASGNERASVMDYPHPQISVREDGMLDLLNAYARGIGEWDKVAIRFGYSEFSPGDDEKEKLNEIMKESLKRGLVFLTDEDARPNGSASPRAHLWDNGPDPVAELTHIIAVRRAALNRFSENNIPEGRPLASLEEVLVPIYLLHRYQVEAVSKLVGGIDYTYALRGDGQIPVTFLSPQRQQEALKAVLATIDADFLLIPERMINLIPPHPSAFPRGRESFPIHTGLTFDPLAAAEEAANWSVGLLLEPSRAARLVEQHARNQQNPGLNDVIDQLLQATWERTTLSGYAGEVQRVVNNVVLYNLLVLAGNDQAQAQVRAIANWKLNQLKQWLLLRSKSISDQQQLAHFRYAADQIERFEKDPKQVTLSKPLDLPPGAPIGMDCMW